MFGNLQQTIVLVVSAAAFLGALWGFVDSLRYPGAVYLAAGKKSKALWVIILGVAAVLSFISLPPPLGRGNGIIGIIGIAAIIAVVYYFVDVRKRLQEHSGGPSRGGW